MIKPKRLTYANVAATLALVFSMSGGAIAASKYLITSTKQISPKVIKKLKGKAGPAGLPGPVGKEGPAGKEGVAGKEGKEGKAGQTSEAFEASSTGATNVTSATKTLSVALPAGSYSITGMTQEQNRDTTHVATLLCILSAEGETLDEVFTDAPVFGSGSYGYGDSVNTVHAGFTTATGATVTFSCTGEGESESTEVFVNEPRLSAIRVGAVH